MNTEKLRSFCRTNPNDTMALVLWGVALSLIVVSFCFSNPIELFEGIVKLVVHPDGLITDYVQVAGFGPTFCNAGIIMVFALVLYRLCHIHVSGPAVACTLLMGGFAMFGKNVVNIWPIIFGVFIVARIKGEHFSKYIYIALYGTSLSPLITEVALYFSDPFVTVLAVTLTGILIGIALVPFSAYCLRVHQGYNLYNVGFAAGLIGTILVSIMKSFGYLREPSQVWSVEKNWFVIGFLYAMFGVFVLLSYLMGGSIKQYTDMFRHSGRLMSDFVLMDGVPSVLMNMGFLGMLTTTYILVIGGDINGATIGGILTVVGFGALGKHLRNVIPVILGVVLGSFIKVWQLNSPSVQLSALFGTALAPISGQFGWPFGMLAGFIHSSVVLNIGMFHGGLNLYNNGFSAGLVALILIPIIESFTGGKEHDNKE